MTLIVALDFVNLFFAGMLAGIEFVIHYGLSPAAETLDERSQLQLRQELVLRLRLLVPTFLVPTVAVGIALAIVNNEAPGFVFRCAGILALLAWILIRIIGTVPINSATITWKLDAPPNNWKAQVTNAERFHIVGVWMAVLAFALFLTSSALNLAGH